jgi:hypothetical protein
VNCGYFEKMLIDLLYKPEHLGQISLLKLRSIFSHMGQGELEKCLEELVKSGRGWVVRNGYLVNRVIVRDIMNEEKRRIENEIKKMEEDLNILRQEADTIEEIRRLWIENPLLKGEWSPKVMLSVYTIWSEKLNTVFGKVKDREEELKRLKNLIEEINTRIEGSFVE